MTARAAPWAEASCGPPVSVAWVGCGGGLEGGEATVAGAVGDAGSARIGRGCAGVGSASTSEAKFRSVSTRGEESK
jgi:hypothetical protein